MSAPRQRTLDEQVADARKVVASWPPEKRARMRLEGTDNFQERMRSNETAPQVEGTEKGINP